MTQRAHRKITTRHLRRARTTTLVAASAILLVAPAHGQDVPASSSRDGQQAAAPVVEEIVVTAQRREQKLQDVGISIAAYGGDMLRSEGITNSTDVARLVPGVTISGTYGGQSTQFSIRGVTQSDFNDAIEGPVAVYIDDMYVASQQGQSMALYDIERVEALKGPQGTLFGRNATGGLVHFVVAKPTLNDTNGYMDVTYGRFQTTVVEGAVNLPPAALRSTSSQ